MGVFEMVVAIVAIVMVTSVIRELVKKKHANSDDDINALNARVAKLEDLEKRVQALETIVTDKKQELKKEIDAL